MTRGGAARTPGGVVAWRALLLGREHPGYGEIAVAVAPDDRSAAALSAGADPDSPARAGKGAPDTCPNEDAALIIDAGDRVLIAVADAHWGHEASHALLEGLAARGGVPSDPEALYAAVRALPAGPAAGRASESTLAVAVLDRGTGRVFGLSYGDSTVALLGGDADGEPLHPHDHGFVSPDRPASFVRGHAFAVDEIARGGVLIAFTDGVDACCYGRPERSLRPHHLAAIGRASRDPAGFVRAVAARALAGVDGEVGGQDNVAIVAAVR